MAGRCGFIQMEMGGGDLEACGEVVCCGPVRGVAAGAGG